jgi:hypothetical protein
LGSQVRLDSRAWPADERPVTVSPVPAEAAEPLGRTRRLWALAFVAFFMLGAAWTFASPYDAPPDEQEHVVRAAGVVYGDVMPAPGDAFRGSGTFQMVPKSLIQIRCFHGDATKTAQCATGPRGSQTLTRVGSYTGRYNPVYYAVVGWPLRFWPNWTGLYLARLLTTAICAMFWATALTAGLRWRRYRSLAVGAIVGITPMALSLAGSVNPNAVEAAAGALLFAALIPVLVDAKGPVSRVALWQSGIAAATIATVRFAGPIWVAGVLGVLLLGAGRERLAELARSRAAWVWAGLVGLATLLSGVWTIIEKAYVLVPLPTDHKYDLFHALVLEIFGRAAVITIQMIGVFGYLDTQMPLVFYLVWAMLAGVLILAAVAFGRTVDRWRVLGILALTYGVPVVSEAVSANVNGFGTQGRYLLVTSVGVTMLAGYALARSGILTGARLAQLTRLVVLVVGPLQLLFLTQAMVRWQIGFGGFDMPINPFVGSWHPRLGSVVPFVLGLLGAAGVVVFGWLVTREVRDDVSRSVPAQVPLGQLEFTA